MRNKRFQNHISESSITLPLCIVIGLLVWFWDKETSGFAFNTSALGGLTMCAITSLIIAASSQKYSLLRIRSQMIVCVWIICMSMMPFTHGFSEGWVAAVFLAGSHYVLFGTYQEYEPVVNIFHSFILLSIALMAIPQLFVLVPLYFWYLLIFMRSLTWRGWWAGIVGLLFPPCFATGWCIITGDFGLLRGMLESLSNTELCKVDHYRSLLSWQNVQAMDFGFISLLSFIGIVSYISNYYNDKIRTRMYLYIYVMQFVACWLITACSPSLIGIMMPVLMVSACTMTAHYFALTKSIFSNLLFILTLLLIVLLHVINYGLWSF